MHLSFVFAIIAGSFGDQSKFRVCRNSPFCVRFRSWLTLKSHPVRSLHLSKVNTDYSTSTGIVDFGFTMKSDAEVGTNYGVVISIHLGAGVFRILVDDIRPTNPRARFRIPSGDVIVSPSPKKLAQYTYATDSARTSIKVEGFYRIEVDHDSFKVRVYNKDDHLSQIINSKNIFAFEKYRWDKAEACIDVDSDPACHSDIDSTGAWRDQFGVFEDIKKYGPSLVGIDVEHINAVSVHGLPEHTTGFTLPYSTDFRFFNADVFQYPLDSGSALYGSIPLLTSVHQEGSASALLWLNPSDTFVSLEKFSASNISSFWTSETGVLDMAILVGPSPADVLKQYHYLTGLPTLPPIFALGYHQSKWGYKSQEEVRKISQKFIDEGISLDVLWLDIQYTDDKKYFTWDPIQYRDPGTLVSGLAVEDERRLVTIIDPHIKADQSYPIFSQLENRDYFVKNSDGTSNFNGQCWPGRSSYPDFTRSEVREFWGSLYSYKNFHGTSRDVWIWNDMNEPSVFDGPEMSFPRDLVHHNNIEHREVHNLYGMYYHRSTYEGLLKRDETLSVPLRPFVLSRSFFVGSHRFGPIWTGDNDSKWTHLQASIPMLLSLSISGMSFSGADVGGFFGDPSKELYIRWQQAAAAFYPFYRCHAHLDSRYREPWTFDSETTELVRDAINLRYTMLPYWYTLFGLYALEGLPIIRPMWFDYMSTDRSTFDDPKLANILEKQIMVGEGVLVRPVVEEGISVVSVYLPESESWWYTFDGSQHFQGGQTIEFPVTISTIPIFVKSGTILPLKKKTRLSTRKMKNDPYTFRVFENIGSEDPPPSGYLYRDDEETMDYVINENYLFSRVFFTGREELMFTKTAGKGESAEPVIASLEIVNQDGLRVVRKGYDYGKTSYLIFPLVGFVLTTF